MAREITYSAIINAVKSGASVQHSISKTSDMTGDDMIKSTQLIGTTSELLTFDEISGPPQLVLIVNLDTANYIEVDSVAGMTSFPQKVTYGDFILLKPQTASIYAKANTASVRILKVAIEA